MKIFKISDFDFFSNDQIVRDGQFTTLGLRGYRDHDTLICAFGAFDLDRFVHDANISCVVADHSIAPNVPTHMGLVVVSDPMEALIGLHLHLNDLGLFDNRDRTVIHATAKVHPTACISETGVAIGENSVVGPHVTIFEGTTIRSDVVVGAGAVLGSDGFEFRKYRGEYINLPHVGGVLIQDGCTIQANSVIARALFNNLTIVGRRCALASGVFVSHGASIGDGTRVGPFATICGSVDVGADVWIGPRAVLSSGITVGENSQIMIGSILAKSVPPNSKVLPVPAKVR